MSISCGHCKGRHESVAQVRECSTDTPMGFTFTDDRPAQPASPGRIPSGYRSTNAAERKTEEVEAAQVKTRKRASEGIYRKAGSIYKVQTAVHGSGKEYAKRLVETASIDKKTGKPKWKFEYAPGFVYELREEHRLSLEQAKEFGALYGTCCVCGRTLTNEDSIEAGIGPICADKF